MNFIVYNSWDNIVLMASDQTTNRAGESFSEPLKVERVGAFKSQEKSKEVKAASRGKDAYFEAVGFDESAETTGKVSEILSDQGEQNGSGSLGRAKRQTFDPAQIRATLLKSVPSEEVMKKQIEKEIRNEIKYLHGKAVKMLRGGRKVSYFEMSNILKKIRELKSLLLILVKASVDTLKTLWLRFVRGVM